MLSAGCYADDKPVPVAQLPTGMKTFAKKYFPKQSITSAQKDVERNGTEYELQLSDGTEIKFDKRGRWEEIDCKTKAVPSSFVPAPIARYVKDKYPGKEVTKVEKDQRGYEVKLSNGLELKFNRKYQFLGAEK